MSSKNFEDFLLMTAIVVITCGSGAHEGTGATPGVLDIPTYESDDEEISWKTSSDDDDDNEGDDDAANDDHDDADNKSERTESDNKGDEFVHPKFIIHDEEKKEEESSNPRVHTPSQSEPSDNELNVDVAQSKYTKEEEVNAEHTYEEEDANDLYRDLNVNLDGRDADMTDAPETTQVIEDTHVTLTLVNPEGHQQSSSTNQHATDLSSIPNIVDNYLGSKLKEAVDVAVQLKSDRIREEAQAENEDFFNKVDENMMKIIKEQVNAQVKKKIDKIIPRIEKLVNEQLESVVLIRSSNEAKTSHAIATNLSELELKKILIDKMKSNKSIDRSDEQKNLYKALVDTYEADKALLDAYGDIVTIKRRRDNADDDQEPSAGPDRGSKRRRAGKEPESSSAPREKTSTTTGKSTEESKLHQQSAGQSAPAEVLMYTADDFKDPTHQEFDTGLNDDQPEEEAHPHPDWFQQPSRLPSPDRDRNKTVPADHGPIQPWLSNLARQEDPRESFDELIDTPLDF
ncbi:hypothetical protein Tco_1539033 [Tanacetum coccineum]